MVKQLSQEQMVTGLNPGSDHFNFSFQSGLHEDFSRKNRDRVDAELICVQKTLF